MSNKANPVAVGAFVVGAIALATIGLLIFGSGKLFKKTTRVVCFFSGDLMGLNVGAPVKFKGVDVGSVGEIRIRIPEETEFASAESISKGARMPVLLDIDNELLATQGARPFSRERLQELIALGMRAQLVSQSLVTGLLLVKLDFRPEIPPQLVLSPESKLQEVPTIPTSMEQLQSAAQSFLRRLDTVDVERLVKSTTGAVESFEQLAKSPRLQETLDGLPATVSNANATLTSLRDLTARLDREQGPLFESLRGTSDKTGATVEEARLTLRSVQTLLAPNAPLAADLATSLRELAAAAHSVRLLAESLERNPSAIVRGKAVPEK